MFSLICGILISSAAEFSQVAFLCEFNLDLDFLFDFFE